MCQRGTGAPERLWPWDIQARRVHPQGTAAIQNLYQARNTPEKLWPWRTLQPVKTRGPESGIGEDRCSPQWVCVNAYVWFYLTT